MSWHIAAGLRCLVIMGLAVAAGLLMARIK